MKTNLSVFTLALLLTLPLAGNAAGPRVLEDGREVEPRMLTLPSRADGVLSIQGCTACKRFNFKLAVEARFYVGDIEVTYTDLQAHLRLHPDVGVLVVSPKDQLIVTRIRASLPIKR
jgi:hypothetical protein